jgi:hypothetical protein
MELAHGFPVSAASRKSEYSMKLLIASTTAAVLALGASTPSSADTYADLQAGTLTGALIVQWLEPDVFLFLPDADRPLKFTRSNGDIITPGRMLTDGGSIPRPVWALRNYSPWGYAPAFIVHDWLFHIKQCKLENHADYDLQKAGIVMGEVIKTLMESGTTDKDPFTVNVMVTAVTSIFAQGAWDNGDCIVAPPAFDAAPLMEYVIDFGG